VAAASKIEKSRFHTASVINTRSTEGGNVRLVRGSGHCEKSLKDAFELRNTVAADANIIDGGAIRSDSAGRYCGLSFLKPLGSF
jgi:hypothetical protein